MERNSQKSPDAKVAGWLRAYEPSLYISTISVGELKFGIERLQEGKRKQDFQNWLSELTDRMKGRVLSYKTSVATVWGQMQARCEQNGIGIPSLDSLLAATAIRHSLVIATRNVNDFRHTGVRVENPFDS